jgi:hypothetical protein
VPFIRTALCPKYFPSAPSAQTTNNPDLTSTDVPQPTCPIRRTMVGYRSAITSLFVIIHAQHAKSSYSNVTVTSLGGNLSVVIYLPAGIKPDEQVYYASTRFDHGSMIGPITRKRIDVHGKTKKNVLYGTERWRIPHNAYMTESGAGLASEFGVGDDGAFCNFMCGWDGVSEVTNGVLGYLDAKSGESFLKIGVGELIKGQCRDCDSADDYKFNSPYQFANRPVWTMEQDENRVTLKHQAALNENGYKLRKDITLVDNKLLVKTTLSNIGRVPFTTAWYSHHFFTCDNTPVGRGYGVHLNLTGTGGNFQEPGTWDWSTPLQTYAHVKSTPEAVSVDMHRLVEDNVKIKAEFDKDDTSNGGFILRACGTSIEEKIPEIGTPGGPLMYAFNLYIESGTFSPEPQILIHLSPGETTSWTQRLIFTDDDASPSQPRTMFNLKTIASTPDSSGIYNTGFLVYMLVVSTLVFLVQFSWNRRRNAYTPIPDN